MKFEFDTTQIRNIDRTGLEEGYLFGHYDSRGGAMLLVAESLPEACMAYNCQFEGADYPAPPHKLESDTSTQDFMDRYKVFVFGPWDPTNDCDLLNGENWIIEKVKVGFERWGGATDALLLIPNVFDIDQWREDGAETGCLDTDEYNVKDGLVKVGKDTIKIEWKAGMVWYQLETWDWGVNLSEDAYGCYFWRVPVGKMFGTLADGSDV